MTAIPGWDLPGGRARPRWLAIAGIVALHVAIVFALLQIAAVREHVVNAVPIMVSLLTEPPKLIPEPPPPSTRPRVRPVERPFPQPQPLLALPPPMLEFATPATGGAITAPPTPEDPQTPVPGPPAPPAPPVQASAPLPVVPPSYNSPYLDNPPVTYPPISRRLGESGLVVLRVQVTADGRPDHVEVKRSSGFPRLDRAAVELLQRWRFVPAKQGDRNVAALVTVPIKFILEGAS